MSVTCSSLVGDGVIRGVLGAVDCQTRAFAQTGYVALTGASSTFQVALTALLTIYVALIGYRMLFAAGGARLSDAPWIALRIGAVLALVTSWATFQTLVFDMAARAPGEIAAIVAAPVQKAGSSLAADPVSGLQTAYDQLTQTALAFGRISGPDVRGYASATVRAGESLSAAAGVLFAASAGVISAATLSIGVLTAIGPVFIALLLIPATRGLFVGWVRALVAAALIPLLGWLVIVLMLSMLEPWLVTLAQQRETATLDPQTAMSAAALIFVFGAGQAALLLSAVVMATGFRWRPATAPAPAALPVDSERATPAVELDSRAQRLAFALQRDEASATVRSQPARPSAAGAEATRITMTPSERPARLGDAYRRPAPAPRMAGGRA